MSEETRRDSFPKAVAAAFPHTLPVLAGFIVLGIAYGVLMRTKGYGTIWAVLMSAVAYCGSMQFIAITLLTVAFNPLQAFLLSIMVNARHMFYGISMLEKYKGIGKARGFLIYTLCDETFSIVSTVDVPENLSKKHFYLAVSLLVYLYWSFGTFCGGVLGNFITFNTQGLDFVLTALYVVLFLEQMKNKEKHLSGWIGIISTTIAVIIFGPENPVVPAMVIILLVLIAGRKKICH